MARKIFNDGNGSKYGTQAGAHVKKGGSKGTAPKREEAYYAKNRSPVGQLQAKQVHRKATKQFSQYDTSAVRPKKGPGGKILAAVVIVIAAIAIFFLLNMFFHFVDFGGGETKTDIVAGKQVEVTVPEGSSTTAIAGILFDNDIIANERAFIDAVNARNAASSLKPGTYELTTLMDTDQLVDALVAGPTFYGQRVSIPEGSTIDETAAYVEQQAGIPAAEFLALARSAESYAADYPFLAGAYNNTMEGYLFPKTYDVPQGSTADAVIRMMLDQFVAECWNAGITYEGANGRSMSDLVIVASMIERESQLPDEMPLIASVVYNRLAQGIALQIDATVVYAMGDAYTGGAVTYENLEIDSPYNTYKNRGLPPGPICSPGIDTLKAAANPAQTDYLYYLMTDPEHHSFFATYDEFLAAKEAR